MRKFGLIAVSRSPLTEGTLRDLGAGPLHDSSMKALPWPFAEPTSLGEAPLNAHGARKLTSLNCPIESKDLG